MNSTAEVFGIKEKYGGSGAIIITSAVSPPAADSMDTPERGTGDNVGPTRLGRTKGGSWSFLDVTLRRLRSRRPSRHVGQTLPHSAFSPGRQQRTGPKWAWSSPDNWGMGDGPVQCHSNRRTQEVLINGELESHPGLKLDDL